MKKSGFTLGEIIVTVSIIGILASITLPQLVVSLQRDAAAKRLSTSMSAIENGFTTAIASEGKQDLTETTLWSQGALDKDSTAAKRQQFTENLGRYMRLNGYKSSVDDVYDDIKVYALANDGSKGNEMNDTDDWGVPILLNNGAVFFIKTFEASDGMPTLTDDEAAARGTSLKHAVAEIHIDVNGADSPNTVGRDIFDFVLGDNGILYPSGGSDIYKYLFNVNRDWTYVSPPESETKISSCTNEVKTGDGWGCTARLIDKHYKMDY